MTDRFAIRRAVRADTNPILALQHAAMRELALAYYDPEQIEAFIGEVGTMDPRLIDDGTYFAVNAGGTLVGCGGWSARAPNYDAHAAGDNVTPLPGAANVRSIFVHPAWARQGIARLVMAHIETEIARASHAVAALTATLSGVPLYRRLGYRSGAPLVLRLPGELLFVGLKMTKPIEGARGALSAA